MFGKLCNGGQICVAPDYLFVPENQLEEYIEAFCGEYKKIYKGITLLTSIINEKEKARIIELIADAKKKGARTVP
ncbi:aldehyde dehydrogenase family protein [Mucilaginibacter paludis]|uniref:aldehyde dehydrogenase family protein n=1 Tax=Mucilaginibacter paludis TaxID=423351 RepID=UPI0002555BDF|nr:aldehyde dehydrogenase family protein [Mucilaginibacter paludis]